MEKENKELKAKLAKLGKAFDKLKKDRDRFRDLAMDLGDLWGCLTCDKLFPSQSKLMAHEKTKSHKKEVDKAKKDDEKKQ
jgi:hypothetical protein